MSGSISVAISRHRRSIQNQPASQHIPPHHLLMLRWCALVMLYGETASLPYRPR